MNEDEMREITGKIRDKIRKKFGKRRDDVAGGNGELSKLSKCEQMILVLAVTDCCDQNLINNVTIINRM